jgi:hypothetical protein
MKCLECLKEILLPNKHHKNSKKWFKFLLS